MAADCAQTSYDIRFIKAVEDFLHPLGIDGCNTKNFSDYFLQIFHNVDH